MYILYEQFPSPVHLSADGNELRNSDPNLNPAVCQLELLRDHGCFVCSSRFWPIGRVDDT